MGNSCVEIVIYFEKEFRLLQKYFKYFLKYAYRNICKIELALGVKPGKKV